MPRIDHVAVEAGDPEETAAFYERLLGARIVKAEGHPVMAYLGDTGFAFHEVGGPGPHTGVRVSEEERADIRRKLQGEGIDYEVAVGLFFEDPDGRQLEAITYKGGEDPRKS
jgi:catechol 2,3-dioxygenase-like lactoylglutathione lyase family enzyme